VALIHCSKRRWGRQVTRSDKTVSNAWPKRCMPKPQYTSVQYCSMLAQGSRRQQGCQMRHGRFECILATLSID
jgi:hypothetical protein